MPAMAEVQTLTTAELRSSPPVVTSLATGGGAFEFAEVLEIRLSTGVTPSKAIISFRSASAPDEKARVTMNKNGLDPETLKYWSRVNIKYNGQFIFIGNLMKRRESTDAEAVVFEYWDDRQFLARMPLRGCYVYQSYANAPGVKYLERYVPFVNPDGRKNCCRTAKDNNAYVFTSLSELLTQTLTSDQPVLDDSGSAPGQSILWTPERFLSYLCAAANANPPAVYKGTWCQIDSNKLVWDSSSIQFQSGTMRNMMPPISFLGKRMLEAIQVTLDVSGEYGMHLDLSNGTTSYLEFHPRTAALASAPKSIFLQRSGSATDIKTAYKGSAETDASDTTAGTLVLGNPPEIESKFSCIVNILNGRSFVDESESTLLPAWTRVGDSTGNTTQNEKATEEYGFLQIIKTGFSVKLVNGAYTPDKALPGSTDNGDGTSSLAHTKQALNFARQSFAKPFRCFQIRAGQDSAPLTGILNGFNGKYQNYPVLLDFKTPLHEQLQPYFDSAAIAGPIRGLLRIPIRISVQGKNDTAYHDVIYNNGLRIESDGLIWFDGLTDDIPDDDSLIYDGSILKYTGAPDSSGNPTDIPLLKNIRINCAVQHDTRVLFGVDVFGNQTLTTSVNIVPDPNNILQQLDPSLQLANGPATQHIVVSPHGFREEHQVASEPALSGSFQTTDGGTPPNLTPLTVPRNLIMYEEQNQLLAAAYRRHKDKAQFARTFKWSLPGIRIDLLPGQFLHSVALKDPDGTNGGDRDYITDAVIDSVKIDFVKPDSEIEGGVRPELG